MAREKSTKQGIATRSIEIRQRYLCQSGGWLGEVVSWLADISGIWDILILCTVIVIAWVVMRTTTMEICVVLGLGFDLVIPLQYYSDKTSYAKHKSHLDHYWPIIFTATAFEIVAYVMIHPDLFTLVACLKTLACSFIWMGVKDNGVYVSSAITRGRKAPADGSRSGQQRRRRAEPKVKGRSEKEGGWWADMDDLLSSWGYDDQLGRSGMIDRISKMDEADRADQLYNWDSGTRVQRERRMDTFADRLLEDRKDIFREMPKDSRVPDADRRLWELYPDPLVRYGMISALKKNKDDEQVRSNLDRWAKEEEHVRRRTAQYLKKAEEKLGIGGRGGGGGGRRTDGTRAMGDIPELPRIKLQIRDARQRLHAQYDDQMTVWGMMDYLSTQEEDKARARLKIWASEDQSAEDKERRAREYRERAEEMLEIVRPSGSVAGSAFSEGRIKAVEGIMEEHNVSSSDREIMLGAFGGPRTPRQEAAIVSRLNRLGMKWKVPDKYSADKPTIRPAGGATPSGLPNEWMDQLDQRMYDAGLEDRRQALDLFERGARGYEESKKKRKVFKRLGGLSPPGTPGSYDTFPGRLGYSHDELWERRQKLQEVGYSRQTIDPMLADFKDQPSREIAETLLSTWLEASKNLERQRKIVLDYQPKTMPVSLW